MQGHLPGGVPAVISLRGLLRLLRKIQILSLMGSCPVERSILLSVGSRASLPLLRERTILLLQRFLEGVILPDVDRLVEGVGRLHLFLV